MRLQTFVFLLWIANSYILISCTGPKSDCGAYAVSYIPAGIEVDPRFLLLETGDIVFSANSSEYFFFYRYDGVSVSKFDTLEDQRFPFLFDGEVAGLKDDNGDEKWESASESFREFLGEGGDVQSVFSFQNGNLIVVKLKGDSRVYLLNATSGTKKVLFHQVSNLHHVDFAEKDEFLVVNADNQLFYMDLKGERMELLFQNKDGHKLNPFIWENHVLFASNADSEYIRIYGINMEAEERIPELIHSGENDVRLPKRYGDDLFFVEIIAGEYLLKKKYLPTGKIGSITQKGVIYDYSRYRDNHLLYIYSDFYTPKSLYLYDINDATVTNIVNQTLELPISYQYIRKSSERSSAYEYFPADTNQVKGVILFFHPGLRSDFSPRWDPILTNLANNGFRIIAPNYPMSFGFGKTFNNADFSDAKDDMTGWIDHLKGDYPELPLYCLASSSGNILMEHVLLEAYKKVNATVSLFGIRAFNRPHSRLPSLYILGENDPTVEFKSIKGSLEKNGGNNIRLLSYPDEGHWFRKSKNIETAIGEIVGHYCRYN